LSTLQSTIGEPFGQVIIEGMAAGKPSWPRTEEAFLKSSRMGRPEFWFRWETYERWPTLYVESLPNPNSPREWALVEGNESLMHFTLQQTARRVEAVYLEAACPGPAAPNPQGTVASSMKQVMLEWSRVSAN